MPAFGRPVGRHGPPYVRRRACSTPKTGPRGPSCRIGSEPLRHRGLAPADGLLRLLLATTLFLGLLLLWQNAHDQSCLALAAPGVAYLAILYGLLEYRLERKRFVVEYYLDRRSSLRGWLRGSWVALLISVVGALPLAVFLAVFAALSRPTDWLFLGLAAALAPLLFRGLSIYPGSHFRRDGGVGGGRASVADVLTARFAGWILVILLAVSYVYFSYTAIRGPGGLIFPDHLELTVEAFRGRVNSACAAVERPLRLVAGIEGFAWHFMTRAATEPQIPGGVSAFLWVAFFLNATVAFTGFVRGLEGCIVIMSRLEARNRGGVADV